MCTSVYLSPLRVVPALSMNAVRTVVVNRAAANERASTYGDVIVVIRLLAVSARRGLWCIIRSRRPLVRPVIDLTALTTVLAHRPPSAVSTNCRTCSTVKACDVTYVYHDFLTSQLCCRSLCSSCSLIARRGVEVQVHFCELFIVVAGWWHFDQLIVVCTHDRRCPWCCSGIMTGIAWVQM